MNPGIFYLYEYNNAQKLRNTGFLKISRYYHSCTLQLNARGIPVAYGDTIRLCAFYLENDLANVTVLAEIPCASHAFSARMNSVQSRFPDGRTLETIDGFFLPLPNGHILAAAAPGIMIDSGKLQSAFHGSASRENGTNMDTVSAENRTDTVSAEKDQDSAEENLNSPEIHIDNTEENLSSSEIPADTPEETNAELEAEAIDDETAAEYDIGESSESAPTNAVQDTPAEPESSEISGIPTEPAFSGSSGIPAEPETPETSGISTESDASSAPTRQDETAAQNVRKIQRSEISVLPRRYWHLANNSFLLHGYHNYNHLILIEKDGHYWLGVPGIYDPHEARAARLFGFPQFTDSYNKCLELSDNEYNPNGTFGYWCCYLK